MPLTTWTCDVCGRKIDDPQMSLVIWRENDDGKHFDYKIVHKATKCDLGAQQGYFSSEDVQVFLGWEGQAYLLSMLSLGPLKGPHPGMPEPVDLDEFVDLFRRLQTPWYEEARGRFQDEDVQREFYDANEVYPYLPKVLEQIAKKQGD